MFKIYTNSYFEFLKERVGKPETLKSSNILRQNRQKAWLEVIEFEHSLFKSRSWTCKSESLTA